MKKTITSILFILSALYSYADEADFDFTSYDVDTVVIHYQSSSPYGGKSPVLLICDLVQTDENAPSYTIKIIKTEYGVSDPFSIVPELKSLRKQKGLERRLEAVHFFAFDGILKALRSNDWPFVSDGLLGSNADVKFQFIIEGKVQKEEEYHFTGNPHALSLLVDKIKGSNQPE